MGSWITDELAQRQRDGLLRRRRVFRSLAGGFCEVDGRRVRNFASNDYLNLAHDPRVVAAAQAAMSEAGVGATASALVCGRTVWHERLERALQGNRHGLRFTELPADYCLELLAQGGRTDFYVFASSIAIYAAASGCRVYSMSRRLAELDPQYRRVVDAIPAGVRARMRFL